MRTKKARSSLKGLRAFDFEIGGNHGAAVYIIKTKFCISSIPQELYIIKPQEGLYTALP